MDNITRLPILRITADGRTTTEDTVVRELPLTILLNERELVTLLCTPPNLDALAVGFLFSEGLLQCREEITGIDVDENNGVVRVKTANNMEPDSWSLSRPLITSAGKKGSLLHPVGLHDQPRVESQVMLSAQEVADLVHKFQHRSDVFRMTGGVHSAALCDSREILVFADDIGRHNAIDKVLGHCILKVVPTDDRVVVTSGRIPSEVLLKVARRRIPVIISVSAPTDLGVKLADDLGITLVGFVRGKRMNVYTHAGRII